MLPPVNLIKAEIITDNTKKNTSNSLLIIYILQETHPNCVANWEPRIMLFKVSHSFVLTCMVGQHILQRI